MAPGNRYRYRLDGDRELPDPASCSQPEGVHGPSAVVDPEFPWSDAGWSPPPLPRWVLYELHVGTFSPEGTFDGVVPHLDRLADLGVTAVELMPVAEFPGPRNWGYDGVDLFAAHHGYGGLDGLRRLVDACHSRGLAVVLDVVYNHLGPEGNHLPDYGPYLTDRYRTEWGPALDFDGPGSDAVRDFFVENARFWAVHAHVDGFRLDAVHAIVDPTAYPFVEELTAAVHALGAELGRPLPVIAESSDSDPLLTAPADRGGRGLDAQWNDDFHHALRTALTGERAGYYADYRGIVDLAEAFARGFVHRGRRSPFRGRRHGRPDPAVPAEPGRLVVFAQNHDQVGNRPRGDRLDAEVPFEARKLAAACVLLAPSIPLIFMGEEYGETAPFPYFTSHTDPSLVEAVRRGRREELAAFSWPEEPPDPQAEATFRSAVLDPALARRGHHRRLHDLYRRLLELRRRIPAPDVGVEGHPRVEVRGETLAVARGHGPGEVLLLGAFTDHPGPWSLAPGPWEILLDTGDTAWDGPGAGPGPGPATGSVSPGPWSGLLLGRAAAPA
ncbi:MAG: malto-oligosyltrehalose trehalohydrolase [Acidimicrobiia bacterium]|nr:malto-oligosyltrehalose trehalohydrolase [Acidimicrobiia bacterium]